MKKYICFALAALLMTSCAQQITRGEQYSKMYTEKPSTILVMAPINNTNHPEAKDYFYTALYQPLCEKGYYVFSPNMTMDLLQSESAYDSEMFIDGNLSKFADFLGADACLFTTIKSWKRNNIGGKITVDVEYELKSTKTGETLYKREGDIKLDKSVSSGNAIVNLIATAINTAATDKVKAGQACSAFVLSDMPVGKYDKEFGKDMKVPAGKSFVKATVK